jgi:acyl-CoA thioesterase FadM
MADIIQEARYRIMKSIGMNDLNLGDNSTGSIMADMVINFKGTITLDDIISVEMDFSEFDEKEYRIFYRILKDDRVCALVETGFVPFSYKENRSVNVPSVFIDRLNSITGKHKC